MGFFIAVWMVLVIAASPFVAVSLAPTFIIARHVRRSKQLAIAGGLLTVALFWALTVLFFALIDLIEEERLTVEGDPPWWAWLAFYDGVFSAPIVAIGALVAWKAAQPKPPVERAFY
jgi:hypothetical protein